MLRHLRQESKATKSKLLAEDRDTGTQADRMILCHVLMRKNCPHQPPGDVKNSPDSLFDAGMQQRGKRDRTRPRKSSLKLCEQPENVPKRRGRPPKNRDLIDKSIAAATQRRTRSSTRGRKQPEPEVVFVEDVDSQEESKKSSKNIESSSE